MFTYHHSSTGSFGRVDQAPSSTDRPRSLAAPFRAHSEVSNVSRTAVAPLWLAAALSSLKRASPASSLLNRTPLRATIDQFRSTPGGGLVVWWAADGGRRTLD